MQPAKWRKTCDPFALNFTRFRLVEVLGYPHAGNDVFHVRGLLDGHEATAYLKVARQPGADVEREIALLAQLCEPIYPKVLDHGASPVPWSLTEELPGQRLSVLLGENESLASLSYLEKYGATLALLHSLHPEAPVQADRSFYHRPTQDVLQKLGLSAMKSFFTQPLPPGDTVFCHGDFHYANLLWQNHHISAILDFELSGYGDRERDIAWALFLRPGQKFLTTPEEEAHFLMGYQRHAPCDKRRIRFFMAQFYVHFLELILDDADWRIHAQAWLDRASREA